MTHFDFYDFLYVIGLVLTVAVAGGAAFWLFRTGMARQAAASWKDYSDAQEKQASLCAEQFAEAKETIRGLQADMANLREMVTSRAEVDRLTRTVQQNHTKELKALTEILKIVKGVAA